MVTQPIIANSNTADLKQASLLHAIGASIFIDMFEGRRDAYFLDIENGTNPLSALAFRLTNGANDTVNYFLGNDLAPTPTIDEVIAAPGAHFARLLIGTNVDTDRAIAEAPQQEAEIRAGVQRRTEQGAALAQVIASAVNADKDTRLAFDVYLRTSRENAVNRVREESERTQTVSDNFFERLISGFGDFVIAGLFAQPRRSGDNKRVSKEVHEYNYLSQEKIASYGTNILGRTDPEGFTHIEVAMMLLRLNFDRASEGLPGLIPGSGISEIQAVNALVEDDFFEVPPNITEASFFSYGDFIDSYHMRKLLAELKKLVQGSRVDNLTAFFRRQGTTREEFLDNTLHRLAPNGFISNAANELLLNEVANPTRPVREFIDSIEAVQAFLGEGDNQGVVPQGPLLRFTGSQPSASPTPNLEVEPESEN